LEAWIIRQLMPGQTAKVAFGRFEASRPNELWVGDALHGPVIGRHKPADAICRAMEGIQSGRMQRPHLSVHRTLAGRAEPRTYSA
jgi:hypothetical protein